MKKWAAAGLHATVLLVAWASAQGAVAAVLACQQGAAGIVCRDNTRVLVEGFPHWKNEQSRVASVKPGFLADTIGRRLRLRLSSNGVGSDVGNEACFTFKGRADMRATRAVGLLSDQQAALAVVVTPAYAISTDPERSSLRVCARPTASDESFAEIRYGPYAEIAESLLKQPFPDGAMVPAVVGKRDPAAKAGYLFVDLTQWNAAKVFRYAEEGAFPYVLVYSSTWAGSAGSYPINLRAYPLGEYSLRHVVEDAADRGIVIGLHVLTSLIHKHDPLVRAGPDPRLLKDAFAVLDQDIDEAASRFRATTDLAGFPTGDAFYGNASAGREIQIGDEILRCESVIKQAAGVFADCLRGRDGTFAAAHARGSRIQHLAQRYGAYLADLKTDLKDQIAERIADRVNANGIGFIYFDAGEVGSANGDPGEYVGAVQMATVARLQRPTLIEGSGVVPALWPYLTRMASDDFATLAPIDFLDVHKIGRIYARRAANLMPAELGWLGLLRETASHPPTLPEEAATYVARSLALDVPFSIETTVDNLDGNPYTPRIVKALGFGNRVIARGVLAEEDRKQLLDGYWYAVDDGRPALRRLDLQRTRATGGAAATTVFPSSAHREPFFLRLSNIASVDAVAPERRIELPMAAPGGRVRRVDEPTIGVADRGALVDVISLEGLPGFAGGLDLTDSRRMLVVLELPAPAVGSCGVLNFQLQDGQARYRDYFVDLPKFSGQHRFVLRYEDAAPRMLRELTPSPHAYALKAAVYRFDFSRVVQLNLRWMKGCGIARDIALQQVAMLKERPATLTRVTLGLGQRQVEVAARISTGDTLDLYPDGTLSTCRSGKCAEASIARKLAEMADGERVTLQAAGTATYDVTIGVLGDTVALDPGRILPRR